jgi:hypothetical protein
MINEKEVIEFFKGRTIEQLYEDINRILFHSKYRGYDTFRVKILILDDLKKRGRLIIKLDQNRGDPYETNVHRLNGSQVHAILKKYIYVKEPLECIISTAGDEIKFKQILTT